MPSYAELERRKIGREFGGDGEFADDPLAAISCRNDSRVAIFVFSEILVADGDLIERDREIIEVLGLADGVFLALIRSEILGSEIARSVRIRRR